MPVDAAWMSDRIHKLGPTHGKGHAQAHDGVLTLCDICRGIKEFLIKHLFPKAWSPKAWVDAPIAKPASPVSFSMRFTIHWDSRCPMTLVDAIQGLHSHA